MKYDFVTLPERRGFDALAVDTVGPDNGGVGFAPLGPENGFSVIPMWVADMNFVGLPKITETIKERLEHPTFGYFIPRDEYYSSIIRWHKKRNGTELTKESIGYENGVLGALSSALRALTAPGEKILVHSPTYIGFTHTFDDTGRIPVHSPLVKDEGGKWRMDYVDMEAKIKENGIRFAVFCSPHNPCGRVWEREEIEKFMDLMKKYDVTVFSDEIWSDIIISGKHVPTHTVSTDAKNRTITAYAPSKTFNLAGLIGSYHVIFDPSLREKVMKTSEETHYNSMNVLSQYALIGAYSEEGGEWTDELCETIRANVGFAYTHIKENYEGVKLEKPEGTYMLYPDFTEYLEKTGRDMDELIHAGWKVGVAWQDGRPFHGENTIRINLALPTETVKEAFARLDRYVFGI